ncbi:LOW QUALITY PROTEIN: 60S ribosomal protein L15, partial [Galemys pyrenaicus]
VLCWQYRQLSALHRAPCPSWPDKARRLGYKAKRRCVMYQVRVSRGGHSVQYQRGATYGEPVHPGASELKFARSLQPVAGRHSGAESTEFLLGWIPRINFGGLSSLIHCRKLAEEILTPSGSLHQSTSAGRHGGGICRGHKSHGLGKARKSHHNVGGPRCAAWRRRNTLQLHRYC